MDILNLQKSFELNLQKANFPTLPTMATKFAFDKSGSMRDNFHRGFVDHMLNRFFVAAMKFDDDGVLEVGAFDTEFHKTPDLKAAADDYTRDHGIRAEGGTSFAPFLEAFCVFPQANERKGFLGRVLSHISGDPQHDPKYLSYLGVVTDGHCADPREFESKLAKMTADKNYVYMIGIGEEVDVNYLTRLAEKYAFLQFTHYKRPLEITDDTFYKDLCSDKFKAWIEARNAGLQKMAA